MRVFIGLAIMAATVSAVGSIGGWSSPEPPGHGSQPAANSKTESRPESKAEPAKQPPAKASRPEPVRIEPAWNVEKTRTGAAAKPERAKTSGTQEEPGSITHAAPAKSPGSNAEPEAPAAESSTRASAGAELTADDALRALKEGNERWVNASAEAPNTSESRLRAVAENGQTPFATILTCADSRVPAERVFDRGVGDLFVVRVAGNVVGPHEAGTIEYGAEHLHVPLLVVMGHTRCGAVSAAASGAQAPGNIGSLVSAIGPAVERARAHNGGLADTELAAASVRENVWQSIFDLIRSSAVCRERVHSGAMRMVGAVYDVSSGQVEWLGEHPWQREIIAAMEARDGERRASVPTEPGAP